MTDNARMSSDTLKHVWVVVPVYNENTIVRKVVSGLVREGYHVVVVDDCSDEPVEAVLAGLPVVLCRHILNLGQGAALQTGINCALQHGAQYIVTFDSDDQHRVEDIPPLLDPVISGKVDVALGSRFLVRDNDSNMPFVRSIALRCATLLTRATTGLQLTDTHNGLRALSRSAALEICITQNRMAHASQILSEISRLNLRYTEVPVRVFYTQYSLAKGQKLSNAFNILWDFFVEVLRR